MNWKNRQDILFFPQRFVYSILLVFNGPSRSDVEKTKPSTGGEAVFLAGPSPRDPSLPAAERRRLPSEELSSSGLDLPTVLRRHQNLLQTIVCP